MRACNILDNFVTKTCVVGVFGENFARNVSWKERLFTVGIKIIDHFMSVFHDTPM